MSDYCNDARLRAEATKLLHQGRELTPEHEAAMRAAVLVSSKYDDEHPHRKQTPQYRPQRRKRVLADKAADIDQMRSEGMSIGRIANALGVSPATVHADLLRRNKRYGKDVLNEN